MDRIVGIQKYAYAVDARASLRSALRVNLPSLHAPDRDRRNPCYQPRKQAHAMKEG
jgi:hypothetical protein